MQGKRVSLPRCLQTRRWSKIGSEADLTGLTLYLETCLSALVAGSLARLMLPVSRLNLNLKADITLIPSRHFGKKSSHRWVQNWPKHCYFVLSGARGRPDCTGVITGIFADAWRHFCCVSPNGPGERSSESDSSTSGTSSTILRPTLYMEQHDTVSWDGLYYIHI